VARIVLNTFGSFGDVHPYLAIAIELKRRGHDPVVATAEVYRAKIEAEGVRFAPVRPNVGDLLSDRELIKKLWDPHHGPEYLIRDYLMPAVEQSFEDLLPICELADLLITHIAGYAGPVVAEQLELRWLSVVLQPMVFFSVFDPPVIAPAPWTRHLYWLGPRALRSFFNLGKRKFATWTRPLAAVRDRAGLNRQDAKEVFDAQLSPYGTLALFSQHFAPPQADWLKNVTVTGFPFYDRRGTLPDAGVDDDSAREMRDLTAFVDGGPAPVLFTLGSSAVMEPGSFYRESFKAAQQLGVRAVLLVGAMPRDAFPNPPPNIHIASYAPYSTLMPKCAASVHQGGIGTTAQAMRSGRPMIVVPWSHDQPDNAHRVERLGVGRTIPRSRYTAARVARELNALLKDESCLRRSRELGIKIAAEDGISAACDVIETALR
jgi:rhamnosyltransferase subunit B